ncbi:hypothetical protein BC829DRAFT_84626 [Chytridium lagenaria]|nr:hypothetical protein BC829DRAFT_84626 [Chytridium lagenaria]
MFDTGSRSVDLSNQQLEEIPEAVFHLKAFVGIDNRLDLTSSVQIYLSMNRLKAIDIRLFQIQNLTVLSLRNNQISVIPHEILALKNLVELNISVNQLRYLPGELNSLPNLTRLHAEGNPFLLPPPTTSSPQFTSSTPSTLFEISLIQLVESKRLTEPLALLPYHNRITAPVRQCLQDAVEMKRFQQGCGRCGRFFVTGVEEVFWRRCEAPKLCVRGVFPFKMRFCSRYCSVHYGAPAQRIAGDQDVEMR